MMLSFKHSWVVVIAILVIFFNREAWSSGEYCDIGALCHLTNNKTELWIKIDKGKRYRCVFEDKLSRDKTAKTVSEPLIQFFVYNEYRFFSTYYPPVFAAEVKKSSGEQYIEDRLTVDSGYLQIVARPIMFNYGDYAQLSLDEEIRCDLVQN